MTQPTDRPAIWREPFADASPERVAVVVGDLVSRAATVGMDAVVKVSRALSRGPREGPFEIACDAASFGCDDDLASAWLWVAAAAGHAQATRMMESLVRERLALEASRSRGDDVDMGRFANGGDGARPGSARHDDDDFPFLDDVDLRTHRAPFVEGKVVIPYLGDPDSKEGVALARRYADVVGRPLPSSGTVPALGVAYRSVVERWPWAERAASEVEGHMALLRLSRSASVRLPPLLFVGRPGCGKSTIAKHVCEILGLETEVVSCAGVGDSGSMAPVARGWANHTPGVFARGVLRTRLANPAFVLEEIDKSPPVDGRNGSAQGVLLGVLGVRHADAYQDSCLMAPVDVTSMTVVATANGLGTLDRALRDRFQVVRVDDPRDDDFRVLLRNVRRDFARDYGLRLDDLPALPHAQVDALRGFLTTYRSARKFREVYETLVKDVIRAEEVAPPRGVGTRWVHAPRGGFAQ